MLALSVATAQTSPHCSNCSHAGSLYADRITMRGRVPSLLAVGTGFHPELTGRENVFSMEPSWACGGKRFGEILMPSLILQG